MRVLQINSVCGIRSTGRICAEMADQFVAQGHECKIAYGREVVPEKYQKYAVRIGNETSVKINALRARLLDNECFNAKAETKAFLEWADSYDPDLLWLHNLHGYYINAEMLFAWIKSRPQMKVMWLLHDCWAFTGHCAYFTVAGCEQWKTQCTNCPIKKDYPSSFIRDNCTGNFEKKRKVFCGVENMTLVTPSQWLADLVKQSFLKEYPVEVRHNTIDQNVFKPTPGDFRKRHGLEDKKIVLGVASAWGPSKGLHDFVKLADMLDDSFAVVLVGLTEKQIKAMPQNIVCISRTNNVQELAEIYTTADVFVNPSKQETFGMTTIEAMACGTDAIVYKGTACEEVVNQYGGTAVEQTPEAIFAQLMQRFGK